MPSIAHLILGGFFGIFLYYISNKRFSKTHVFVIFLNNYIGPDVGWIIGLGRYTHSILFWPVFALLLAYIYYYFTKFTLKIEISGKIDLVELDFHKLKYLNTYFLVLAGGIMHNYLDSLINYGGLFNVFPQISSFKGLTWTLEDFMRLWETGFITVNPVLALIVGILFIFSFFFVFIWFLKFFSRKAFIIVIVHIIGFIIIFFLLGSISTANHSDVGAILYISLFWLTPLFLCLLSTKEFKSMVEFKVNLFKSEKQKIRLISIYFLIGGFSGVIISIFGFIFNKRLLDYIIENYGSELPAPFGEAEISFLIHLVVLLIMFFSLVNIACANGLMLKNRMLWRFAIYYQLLFSWTIIGLIVACTLSENSIKKIFDPHNRG